VIYAVALAGPDDLDGFRNAVRRLICAGIAPAAVSWTENDSAGLFGAPPPENEAAVLLPRAFITLAEDVACHRDAGRWAMLYEAIWRMRTGERGLLDVAADPLVHRLRRMQRAVRHDVHRMTAFTRFRGVTVDGAERFVAWYEPDHRIHAKVAPFFVGRFASMTWSILTPAASLHWDRTSLAIGDGVARQHAPREDALEAWWRDYYRATFNPSRLNVAAMRAHMPRRFWQHLPEAASVNDMVAEAGDRHASMIAAAPGAKDHHAEGADSEAPRAAGPRDTQSGSRGNKGRATASAAAATRSPRR